VNLFVAAFIGSPSMNLVEATVSNSAVRAADLTIPLPDTAPPDGRVVLGVRPTGFSVANGDGRPTITVQPRLVEELGDERYVIFDLDAPRVDTDSIRAAMDAQTADDALLLPEQRAQFTARLPADAPVTVGEPLTLAIDPQRLHFFDPETGLAR
jgi:multiple sugar transport system ATP-binding protein